MVAQDFRQVVGTQDLFHTRIWFCNVFSEEVGDPGSCTDVNAPLKSHATECVALAGPGPSPASSASAVGFLVAGIVSAVMIFL